MGLGPDWCLLGLGGGRVGWWWWWTSMCCWVEDEWAHDPAAGLEASVWGCLVVTIVLLLIEEGRRRRASRCYCRICLL